MAGRSYANINQFVVRRKYPNLVRHMQNVKKTSKVYQILLVSDKIFEIYNSAVYLLYLIN